MSYVDEFLAHYGVKGMRWGVRRQRGKGGRVTTTHKPGKKPKVETDSEKISSKISKKSSDSGSKGGVDTSKKVRSLSDVPTDELKSKVKRLNLEKQYKTLQGSPPEIDGKALTQEIITTVGKQTAIRLGNEVAYAIGKEFTDVLIEKSREKIRSKVTRRKKKEESKE